MSGRGEKQPNVQQTTTRTRTSTVEREENQFQEHDARQSDYESPFDDEWLKNLPIWAVAVTRILLGGLTLGGGVYLAFNGPQEMSILQAAIVASLFAFGAGMLSAFFTGSLRYKRKNSLIATGSFALFIILIYVLRGKDLDISFFEKFIIYSGYA